MRRLRLLHTEASCGWGGQELRVLAEAQGMMRRGHTVWIAAPAESKIFGEAIRRELPAIAVPIARRSIAGTFSLRAFMADQRPDVVNTHSSTDSWMAALARAGLAGAPPLVRTRHISAPIPGNALTHWLYRRATVHIVTTGDALRAQVIEQAGVDPSRVTSVPTGIDLSVFRPGDPGEARKALGLPEHVFLVVIVATLRSWKGHSTLIDALAKLEGAHLAIVGDGPGRDNIRSQVQALALGGRVHLAGHREDVVPWLQAADVAALPSYANEGVPQSLMQAMACALPVLTTSVGAIAEIVRDGVHGLIVPPRDPAALVSALTRLRGDAALRRRLGAAGLDQARERFSVERMLDAMEGVFDRVAASESDRRVEVVH